MYKNFNSSTDYTKNAFEQFTRKKQVNTKFARDKKSYNKHIRSYKDMHIYICTLI